MALFAQLRRSFSLGLAQLRRAWAPDGVIVIPAIVASNAHVINLRTSQVYYSKGTTANEDRPASLTKLMTVLVLLDYKPGMAELSQTVTIVSSDLVGGSGNNLLAGDVLTLHALMMDALLPSSNSAATAIARTIGQELLDIESGGAGDPVARFVTAMNAKASSIGCAETTFFNASGLGGDNTSSPADINVIASLLWQSEIARAAWQYQTYGMPVTRSGSPITVSITTSNQMFSDAGIVGGKTGTLTTGGATYNLTVLWRAPNLDVVALTIFGSSSDAQRYADMRALVAALAMDYPELSVEPISLSGAAVSISTATGTLITSIQLAGSAASLSTAGGNLTAQITLSGAALAQAAATAALTAGAADLAGDAHATAAALGTLTTQIRLSGAAVSQALAGADLTTESDGLSGSAQASATAMGLLGTGIPLVGEATATASAAGSLGVPIMLSGAAAAVSSATGELTIALALEGHSLASALASGSLTTQIRLSAAALGRAAASGALAGTQIETPARRIYRVRYPARIMRVTT